MSCISLTNWMVLSSMVSLTPNYLSILDWGWHRSPYGYCQEGGAYHMLRYTKNCDWHHTVPPSRQRQEALLLQGAWTTHMPTQPEWCVRQVILYTATPTCITNFMTISLDVHYYESIKYMGVCHLAILCLSSGIIIWDASHSINFSMCAGHRAPKPNFVVTG